MLLISWDVLARPKVYGEWGIKIIFHFGFSLAAKNLWRDLFSKGSWSYVLKTKYLKQENVYEWISNENKRFKGISNSWNCLLNSFSVVKDSYLVAWKWTQYKSWTGSYSGATCFYRLSGDLVDLLHA